MLHAQNVILRIAGTATLALLVGAPAPAQSAPREPTAPPAPTAQTPSRPQYSLQDCLRIGLREASAMRNARRDREIADRVVDQVRAQFLPSVTADASYTRRDELDQAEFGGQTLEIGSLDNYSISLSARQLLYSGGSVSAALDAARDYRVMADFRTQHTYADLTRAIRTSFTDLLYLQAALATHEQTVTQWQAALERTEELFAQDMAAEFDVLQARVQWSNARPGLIQASNQVAVAKASFAHLLNLPDDRFDLRGELRYEPFTGDIAALTEAALRQRPEYRIAQQGLSLREAEIRAERSAYRPSLHASFLYGAQPSPFGIGGSDLDWRWSATLQAKWSLLDGGLRRHRVREKELEREKTLEDLEALRRRVALEVQQALLAIRQAEQAVQAMRETVALADKAVAIATTRYQTKLIPRLELAEANLASMTARLHWLGALRDHARAVTALRYAAGLDRAAPPDALNKD
jgi:outer membrane protein